VIAIGELICSAVMVGVFAMLGFFRWNVLWSALAGSVLMVLNFFFLSVTVSLASDRAAQGEVKSAQKMIQTSSTVRLLVLGVALLAGIKIGANPLALLLPLAFQRPILMVAEFFRKKGDAWTESK
jgi:CBS domain containing-hemolysin-like protein